MLNFERKPLKMRGVMDKSLVYIEKVITENLKTPLSVKDKGWNVLAKVNVRFYEITVHCLLIEGFCKKKNANFYFLELPCMRFRNRNRHFNINLFNFESKEDSERFQVICFETLFDEYKELFPKVYLDLRAAQKEYECKPIKARSKSKFAKD